MAKEQEKQVWVSVPKYAKIKKLRTAQMIYNRIATGRMKKDVEWREREIIVKRKEVLL